VARGPFEEIRDSNIRSALSLSREEARQRLVEHHLLNHPGAAQLRAKLLASPDAVQPAQFVQEVVVATGMQVCHSNVDELWYLEGLIKRASSDSPDGASRAEGATRRV
jgi:hypothetical protein